jgi:hypothetical protein
VAQLVAGTSQKVDSTLFSTMQTLIDLILYAVFALTLAAIRGIQTLLRIPQWDRDDVAS